MELQICFLSGHQNATTDYLYVDYNAEPTGGFYNNTADCITEAFIGHIEGVPNYKPTNDVDNLDPDCFYVFYSLSSIITPFHIFGDSPAVNAGETFYTPAYDWDIDYNIRGSEPEIGADEWMSGNPYTLTCPY